MAVRDPGWPFIQARSYGHNFPTAAPVVVAVHCTQTANARGTAAGTAGPNWFAGPNAGTSAHSIVDRDEGIDMVHESRAAYHAGKYGNVVGLSIEICGKVEWSKAKWREPEQMAELRLAAKKIAYWCDSHHLPARWLSLAQLAAVAKSKDPTRGGLCTHNDIRLALGGTTHTDPGPNFPYAELLQMVQDELGGTPTTAPPVTSEEDWLDMADIDEVRTLVRQVTTETMNAALTAHANAGHFQGLTASEHTMLAQVLDAARSTDHRANAIEQQVTGKSADIRDARTVAIITGLKGLAGQVSADALAEAVEGLDIPEATVDALAARLVPAVQKRLDVTQPTTGGATAAVKA